MDTTRRPDDLLDVARVLLLLQGAILVATTIEALLWGFVFAGTGGVTVLLSGATAAAVLVARARLRADRRWTRRLVYGLEGFILAALALDSVLAILMGGGLPPAVALLTRLLLPIAVIVLLRRSARATHAPVAPTTVAALEGVS